MRDTVRPAPLAAHGTANVDIQYTAKPTSARIAMLAATTTERERDIYAMGFGLYWFERRIGLMVLTGLPSNADWTELSNPVRTAKAAA
jgi:hypothetical protein